MTRVDGKRRPLRKLTKILRRWITKKPSEPRLQSYLRQQEKFHKAYPNYTIGFASYGFPIVHDDDEGTTLTIGSYCSIASGVQIFLGKNHRTDWVSSYPFPAFFEEARGIGGYSGSKGDVVIGSDVWLCANCIVLSGINIGHGAVVGAGAVVTRDVTPYSVVAGNPAKHVRWRFEEPIRDALLRAAWWDWSEHEIRSIVTLLCDSDVHTFLAYVESRPST